MAKSVGFQDENGGGVMDGSIPQGQAMQSQTMQGQGGQLQFPHGMSHGMPQGPHTNPMRAPSPLSPLAGHQAGIETPQNNQ